MKINTYPHNTRESNADYLPVLKPDAEVKLIRADEDGLLFTPDWFSSLVLVEVHPDTATEEGTLEAMIPVLDHLAAMGVNGIWVTPIYEKGPGGNGYGNWGPHTLEPTVTGCDDVEEGWKRVAAFVNEAHKRRIRVLLDIITWGTVFSSPLRTEHPDWFRGEAWGGAAFNWDNDEFRAWFIDVCIDNILKSGADGYRCDCEPVFSGYRVFAEIRTRLLALGRKIAIIAEESSERRGTYDCEQDGITGWIGWSRGDQYREPKRYFLDGEDIVACVKSGKLHGDPKSQQNGTSGRNRYYTYCVSNHDYQFSITNKNRLVIGYQAIFAPFIPLWYLGAEIGMEQNTRKTLYFIPTDWTQIENEENRRFCRDVSLYLRIRRKNPDIFTNFPMDHRDSNIAALDADTALTSYARYANGHAILVIPRKEEENAAFTVRVDPSALGIPAGRRTLKDEINGGTVAFTEENGILTFTAEIPEKNTLGVYHLL